MSTELNTIPNRHGARLEISESHGAEKYMFSLEKPTRNAFPGGEVLASGDRDLSTIANEFSMFHQFVKKTVPCVIERRVVAMTRDSRA